MRLPGGSYRPLWFLSGLGAGLVLAALPSYDRTARPPAPIKEVVAKQVEAPPLPDLKGNDPKRFANCEAHPTHVKRLACRAGAAAFAVARQAGSKSTQYFQSHAAIEAANLVRFTMSSARYSYLKSPLQQPLPVGDEECLGSHAGICGNHIAAYQSVMSELGIDTRPVQFFYMRAGERGSHIAAEFSAGSQWNFIDVTWGFAVPQAGEDPLYKDISRIGEDGIEGFKINGLDIWAMNWTKRVGPVYEYLESENVDIVVNNVGTINFDVRLDEARPETFAHRLNFVGDLNKDGRSEKSEMRWTVDRPASLTLHVSGIAGCDPAKDRLVVGDQALPIAQGPVVFTLEKSSVLTTESSQDVCYVVFSKAELAALRTEAAN